MRKWAFVTLAILSVSLGATAAHAAGGKPRKTPDELFKKLDKDGDGKLTLAEFTGKKSGDKATKAEKMFKAKDKDGDGSLTLDEFKSHVKTKKEK